MAQIVLTLDDEVLEQVLHQAKAENFGVDGEDDLHRARKQAAGAPRVIRSSETVVERDDTPYWDIYRNARN